MNTDTTTAATAATDATTSTSATTTETTLSTPDHPLLTTPFTDYTVTEGLLLVLVILFLLKFIADGIRRIF